MTLDVMEPNPTWNRSAHEATIATLGGLDETVTFKVWCDDGCNDCRAQMPDFAAALDAAGIREDRIRVYAVERLSGGEKRGPKVDEYGIGRIPTVVVERGGEEVARYVEDAAVPAATYLAERLRDADLAT